ncbi:hypothetical protein [Actinomadura rubteroloni]|uniref:hypothetical protein n=1 Tax=Actinomadura rubteroloni TaxID=1926885 RepID=UPI00196B3140|nr:hypothetical protein [Actinomadura rubteroloni]
MLTEARWTGQQLANAINEVGSENGVATHFDRTSVAHWLAGTRPRPPTPDLLVEALARRLGRPLTRADCGLADPAEPSADRGHPSGGAVAHSFADLLTELRVLTTAQTASGPTPPGRPVGGQGAGIDGVAVGGVGPYRLDALAVPEFEQAVASVLQPVPHGPGRITVGSADVYGAREMARVFAAADDVFGGGVVRRTLACYLSSCLAPRLHGVASPGLRSSLLTAATQLAYLCGFMCFDDQEHGLAERYYLAALRLAAYNADPTAYAITLRGMSVQARSLGHHTQALQLAESAVATTTKHSPVRRAFLYGQLAVAHAAHGDRTRALTHLTAAERHLDRATSQHIGSPPGADAIIGGYHPAALFHQQAAVRALLGDSGAIDALRDSIRHRPPHERRSRTVLLARLAELQLAHGHLEQAVATWHQFLDGLPGLACGRVSTAMATMRSRLRPHANAIAARPLLRRAAAMTSP